MAKTFLTYATAVILQALHDGFEYGFDIIDATGLPGGTVYPALRRLEEAGYLSSSWEKASIAQVEPRPPRRYYTLTRTGREKLAEAAKRYPGLERRRASARDLKPSRA